MSERLRFVIAARRQRATFRSLCAAFGVAPKTGYKWLHEFEAAGPAGLVDRSRRPKTNSRAIPGVMVLRLVNLRQEHPTWGPKKLVAWLSSNEPELGQLPAASTVGELLKRRGLVATRSRLRHHPPRTAPLRHADKPNAVWAMDFKGWFRLGDGTRCDPLTITDAFSRYLLCCKAGTALGEGVVSANVWASLVRVFREYGMPAAIRVDNGQPWTAPKGSLGITKLAVKLLKAGVAVERIQPGKPQQNGRHERFHLTLHQETVLPPARSMRAQQRRFNAFQREYNEVRPHEALQQRPPAKLYVPSPRPFPERIRDPDYPVGYEVHRPWRNGCIALRGAQYRISSALGGERVGFLEVEEGCFEVYFCNLLLGRIHTSYPGLGLIAA